MTTQASLIRDVEHLTSDCGLARYRFTTVPWLWYTTQGRHKRVFQDKPVLDIIEQLGSGIAAVRQRVLRWTGLPVCVDMGARKRSQAGGLAGQTRSRF